MSSRHRARALGRVVVFAVAVGVAITACGRGDPPTRSAPRSTRVEAAPAEVPTGTTIAPRDGSLGDENSIRACTLLDAGEIEAQFGGPVDDPAPIYPYCQWIVGEDQSAFVAVTIIPMPIAEARAVHTVRSEIEGIGDDAYIASTRAIIFGRGDATYSILWQKVGDFTNVETEKLSALALDVLARV